MVQTQSKKDAVATDTGGGGGGVSLGKGAWDCDRNIEIPPEAEVRAKRGRKGGICVASPFNMMIERLATVAYAETGKRNASRQLITPRLAQAEVFEEIATMEFPFEGIPTIPPRKNMDNMVNSLITEDLDCSTRHSCCCPAYVRYRYKSYNCSLQLLFATVGVLL